ncbi:hypothetical protein GCM10010407_06810 [Rarobacter incanus]
MRRLLQLRAQGRTQTTLDLIARDGVPNCFRYHKTRAGRIITDGAGHVHDYIVAASTNA